jgi:hypothetical protein
MRHRWTSAGVALAAGIVLALYFSPRGAPESPAPKLASPPTAPSSATPVPPKADAGHRPSPVPAARDSSARSIPEVAPPEPAAAAVEGGEDVLLEGRVILVAADGEENQNESGSLTLRVFPKGGERQELALSIVAGRFTASVPRASDLDVSRMELGGVAAAPAGLHDYFPPPGDGVLEIRAGAVPSLLLHVLDSETGDPLRDVTVARRSGTDVGSTPSIPGAFLPHELVVSGGDSPVRFATMDRYSLYSAPLFVHAPGHAWARLDAHSARAGEATVRLERGGDLVVALENYRPVLPAALDAATRLEWIRDSKTLPFGQAVVRLVRLSSSAELCRIVPAPDAPTRVVGLLPGEYRAEAVLFAVSSEPIELGAADVTIAAGLESEICLRLADVPALEEPVPLSGTLHVPIDWGRERMPLVFRPLEVPGRSAWDAARVRADDLEEIPWVAGSWRFDAGLVMPGRYAVEIGGYSVDPPVDVGEAGLVDLALGLAAPASVTLRLVSADDGAELDIDGLTWIAVAADGGEAVARQATDIGPTQLGRARFQCPAGEVSIGCREPDVSIESGRVMLVPGENDVTLSATVACGFLAVPHFAPARDGSKPLSFSMSIRRADGAGPALFAESRHGLLKIRLPEPGAYEVTTDPIEGCEPIAPFTVNVGAGEWKSALFEVRALGTPDEK